MVIGSQCCSLYDLLITLCVSVWGSVGVGICRDLRYPELALHYGKEGVLIVSIIYDCGLW